MAASTLECLRIYLEDIEQTESAIATLLETKYDRPENSKSTAVVLASDLAPYVTESTSTPSFVPPHNISLPMYYDITVAYLLKENQKSAKAALELFADQDSSRKDEVAFLAGNTTSHESDPDGKKTSDVWTNFYDRVKTVKDYHRKFNSTISSLTENDATGGTARSAAIIVKQVKTNKNNSIIDSRFFTEEEHGGKRIDLASQYNAFVNIAAIRHFREARHKVGEVARMRKKLAIQAAKQAHRIEDSSARAEGDMSQARLESMIEPFREIDYIQYLKTFDNFNDIPRSCRYRSLPYLRYIDDLLAKLRDFFHKTHALAPLEKIEGRFVDEFADKWNSQSITDWQDPPTHQDSLYAIYTDKLFASPGLHAAHIKGKKYLSLQKESERTNNLDHHKCLVERSLQHDRELALKEFHIGKFRSIMSEFFDNSIAHVQKKQSRTAKELEAHEEDLENEGEDDEGGGYDVSDDDEDKPVYNPLSLPLGWDGKPIPFWLYKLHGLGTEFRCEICGNYSYWGRRAFERHFQEWRHAMGMKCLKIPNTAHFKEITQIEDAITLYDKLKREADQSSFKLDQEMECEDSQGNVMSARAYEDLRRQGLL